MGVFPDQEVEVRSGRVFQGLETAEAPQEQLIDLAHDARRLAFSPPRGGGLTESCQNGARINSEGKDPRTQEGDEELDGHGNRNRGLFGRLLPVHGACNLEVVVESRSDSDATDRNKTEMSLLQGDLKDQELSNESRREGDAGQGGHGKQHGTRQKGRALG